MTQRVVESTMADAADEGVAWESSPLPEWPTQPKWAWLEKRVLRVQTGYIDTRNEPEKLQVTHWPCKL